jgi:CHASE3 domain sensor protein
MRQRTVRFTIITLLLASLAAAAGFLWSIEQRAARAAALASSASTRLAHISDTIAGIGTAQQSYVAPGQLDEPWFERASMLMAELERDTGEVRGSLRAPESQERLHQLTESVATLKAADGRTRENLQLGQELMASDVIFSDGRNLLDSMIASVHDLQTAEQVHLRAQLNELSDQRWLTYGSVALVWLVGLLVLPGRRPRAMAADSATDLPAARLITEPQPRTPPRADVDLAAAANVCTDLSRITTTQALPGLLGRAAGALDATGLILWISAGEQLFPVMAHGYSDDVLARMGPIARDAENAAASAWRSGQLTVVRAGNAGGQGAIVTPLFGLHNCIGVLSAELRKGEENPAVQAVATIIAAQLSTVVPAWPAGSLHPGDSPAASEARSA